MMCSWQSWIYSTPFRRTPTFSWPLVSLRPALDMRLGRVAFSSMFLKRKKSQRFGASSFSKFHNTFATPRTVIKRAKKSLCNRSQFRTLFLPHRFIKIRPSHQRPVSIEFLTIYRIPEFPKSEQNRKSWDEASSQNYIWDMVKCLDPGFG